MSEQIELTIADLTKVNFYTLEKEIQAKIGTGFSLAFVQPNKLQVIGDGIEAKKSIIEGVLAAHTPPTPISENFYIPTAATKTAVEAKVGQVITDPAELGFYLFYTGSLDKAGKVRPTAEWWPKLEQAQGV